MLFTALSCDQSGISPYYQYLQWCRTRPGVAPPFFHILFNSSPPLVIVLFMPSLLSERCTKALECLFIGFRSLNMSCFFVPEQVIIFYYFSMFHVPKNKKRTYYIGLQNIINITKIYFIFFTFCSCFIWWVMVSIDYFTLMQKKTFTCRDYWAFFYERSLHHIYSFT